MNTELTTRYFLLTGKIEGYSYLLLLFIAMPLKYIWEMPEWVKITGMAHGILFIAFLVFIALMTKEKLLSTKNAFYAFLLSLVPFGTFFLSPLLKKN